MHHQTLHDVFSKVNHLRNVAMLLGDPGDSIYQQHAPLILTGLATGDQDTVYAGLRALRADVTTAPLPAFPTRVEADFVAGLIARAQQWDI